MGVASSAIDYANASTSLRFALRQVLRGIKHLSAGAGGELRRSDPSGQGKGSDSDDWG